MCRRRRRSAQRRTAFHVRVEGIDVRWFQFRGGSHVQATLEFDEREAARYAGVPWTTYVRLDGEEKARLIAHYRLSRLLERVLQELEARKQR